MNTRGVLLVLEGSDGAGKTTQFNLLRERLKAVGYDVATFDFPRYEHGSSYFVKKYLNGEYGPASEISPYTASLFYALDRFEAAKDIRQELEAGKIVLCNRYVGSNMAHQGAKFEDPVEQRGFFVWEDNLEYRLLDIPRPDTNLFLRVPAEVSFELIKNKAERQYTSKAHDEHEADINHLKKAVSTYDLLCQLFPKDFSAIECTKNDKILSIPEISNLVWAKIQPLLPQEKPHSGHSTVVTLGTKNPSTKKMVETSGSNLVHNFKSASLHLKMHVERHIRSVEPAGFSIWSDNNYDFYTPQGLPAEAEAAYKAGMQAIAELHRQMRQKLSAYYEHTLKDNSGRPAPNIASLLMPVTPLAAIASFQASLSPKSVKRVCSALLSNDADELQWAAKQIYLAARQKWPDEFSGPLESESTPEALNNIISKIADERLTFNSADTEAVKLLEASPRQEFDLLAESIYPYSSLPLDEIVEEVSDWSYQQKYDSLKQASAEPGLLMGKTTYKFDLLTDQLLLAEITSLISDSNPQSQNPSPRNGYEVDQLLEEAGIDDLFVACFDESLKIYSLLQAAERDDLAIYASLLGHKLRWQLNLNALEMKALLEHRSDNKYRLLIEALKDKAAEVHPLMWDVIYNNASPSSSPKSKARVKPSRRRPSKKRK
jgi:dTMP kinase